MDPDLDDLKNFDTLKARLLSIYHRDSLLSQQDYLLLLERVNQTLENEEGDCRPRDSSDLPGGLLYLSDDLPTILVPDIHARMDFLISLFFGPQIDALKRLAQRELQIVCVGDAFHGEARVAARWFMALSEYMGGFQFHSNMDREMIESLGVMEMVMIVKSLFPYCFHFLKGNHENIKNEYGGGNYPFVKFVNEGAMVALYVHKFLGPTFHDAYYRYEKNFPLLAVGKNFLVSHGEPRRFYSTEEVVEYRTRDEVVEGFTWTDNGQAHPGSVQQMLAHYLGEQKGSYYFGGHRPVSGLYFTRAEGKYVQFHNPNSFNVVTLDPDADIDLARDVVELENCASDII
jgi:hypothetical protein